MAFFPNEARPGMLGLLSPVTEPGSGSRGVWHRGAVVHRPGDRKNGPGSGIGKSDRKIIGILTDGIGIYRNDRTPPKNIWSYIWNIIGKSLESPIFQTLSKRCEAMRSEKRDPWD